MSIPPTLRMGYGTLYLYLYLSYRIIFVTSDISIKNSGIFDLEICIWLILFRS